MAGNIWFGTTDITETVGSPLYDFTASKNEATRVFEGQFEILLAGKPAIGSTMSGFTAFTVERVQVKNLEGDKGQMTVGLFQAVSMGYLNTGLPIDPIYEIDWVQVDKPLETHPIYKNPSGTYNLTDDDLVDLQTWEQEPDPVLKKAFSYNVNGDTATLGPNAQNIAKKKLKGVTSYLLFIPVLKKTSSGYQPPSTSAAGHVEVPPGFPSVPTGYTFIKTADRGQRTGKNKKWERQEEWTGFDTVDSDLYPT